MNFIAHAEAHGLLIGDLIADGRWHRCPTVDKPNKRNGAYLFDGDRGVVKNFATMQDYAAYRNGVRAGSVDKAMLRVQRKLAEVDMRARQTEARAKAEDMVKRASLDVHPYLTAKGFPTEKGLVLDGELLIPMREFSLYRQINSVQRISADGTKLFLAGGKAKGSVFFIGPYLARERWLCEGYATGLSIRAALRWLHSDGQVIVCFSASNLMHIGKIVRAMSVPAHVIADNDKSEAGERAAEETGLPWGMPGSVDQDANDMHQKEGVGALAELIREVRAVRQRQETA